MAFAAGATANSLLTHDAKEEKIEAMIAKRSAKDTRMALTGIRFCIKKDGFCI